jgi:hypothetical protein
VTALLRRLQVVDALLDAVDHFGAHNRLTMNFSQVIRGTAHDLGLVLGLGVPRAARNQTLILLHRNLLFALGQGKRGADTIGS